MSSFKKPNAAPAAISVPASSNAQKVFTTNNSVRAGYSICNLSTTDYIYVQELPVGSTLPTVAAVLLAPTAIIPPLGYWDSGAGPDTDVYVGASSASSATAQEKV